MRKGVTFTMDGVGSGGSVTSTMGRVGSGECYIGERRGTRIMEGKRDGPVLCRTASERRPPSLFNRSFRAIAERRGRSRCCERRQVERVSDREDGRRKKRKM
jgi:hypothetical protein